MALTLHIGRKAIPVQSFADASSVYGNERDAYEFGASQFPNGTITDGSTVVAYVSYNGKVWKDRPSARDWMPGTTPLFNPYA